jgi:hypothetical protein
MFVFPILSKSSKKSTGLNYSPEPISFSMAAISGSYPDIEENSYENIFLFNRHFSPLGQADPTYANLTSTASPPPG